MKTQPCTCGQEGQHWHLVDDRELCLCGRCNAVLSLVIINSEKLPIDFIIARQPRDENGETFIDRFAKAPPSDSRPVRRPVQVNSNRANVDKVDVQDETDGSDSLRSFFVTIPQGSEEVVRTVPQVQDVHESRPTLSEAH